MAIKLNSNFDYRGSNPNFERDVVETFEELKNLSGYPDGHLVYCKETKLHYKYNEELESGETGKFEEFKTGGGIEIVSSVEELDPDAEQGSLASVLETTAEEKILTGTVGPDGVRVKHVEIEETTPMSMGSLEFILTTKDGKNIEIRSLTTSGYPTNSHRLYFIDPNSNEFTLATFGSPYSNVEQNSENIETLNQLLQNDKYYGKDRYNFTEASTINEFFREITIEKENINTELYVKNTSGWEQYSELVDQSVTTDKVADGAIITEKISDSSVTLEKLSTDVQDKFTAIESQLTSKSTSIDFGANEDTTTLAIMDPSVITKIKTMNISNLYISYGDVVKQEIDLSLSEQNIDLGDADFIVINITRTTAEIDAALGLTFINKTV